MLFVCGKVPLNDSGLEDIDDFLSCAPQLNRSLEESGMQQQKDGFEGDTPLLQKKAFVDERRRVLYGDAACNLAPSSQSLSNDQLRPGDAHSVYLTRDVHHLLHPSYKRILHHASQIVCCQETEMADTVHAVEIGLIKTLIWRRRSREEAQRQKQREEQGKRRPGRPRKAQSENSNFDNVASLH